MRVTQSMISNNMLTNLSNSYSKLDQYNSQLASGKKINKPSDDPVIAMKGIYYRSDVTQVEQYKRNLDEATNWVESSDDALNLVTNSLQRIRELTVQGASDTNSAESRKALAEEVRQLIDHIGTIGNTMVGDKYIFNGVDTTTKPVNYTTSIDPLNPGQIDTSTIVKANFYTNNSNYNVEVSKGVNVSTNVDPSTIFDPNTFKQLADLHNALVTDNTSAINTSLGQVDTIIQNVLTARTKIGATQNRVDMISDRLGNQEVVANRIMSNNEDANVEEVITKLKTQESVQNAALGVGARIIQPTLLDFLR
ncbi:flagellar hook-associated protein FlgL [Bacillus sp. RG28]|uniref:Flagellar hook-associated protein FlgL n=1 Tax=Gottfriedia endophytica TaxID=2820819 RepID=A0A940NSI6_9BACI|nr:flagellar hook-associated protein FlgL [Gottfriedia endophytica]MBP0726743.1 flagellar hook-associated protein FlgL [Gottfriedia endophytica]